MTVTVPTKLRLLVPAVLLTATGTIGGSAVVAPATACAAPSWDIGSYELCLSDIRESDVARDLAAKKDCCLATGGEWKRGSDGAVDCFAPPIEGAGPAGAATAPPPPPGDVVPRPTVTPPSEAATETPPTPRLPVAPQPSGNATVAPPPATPPTTSTVAPPPLR